jgi:hypothetical protein
MDVAAWHARHVDDVLVELPSTHEGLAAAGAAVGPLGKSGRADLAGRRGTCWDRSQLRRNPRSRRASAVITSRHTVRLATGVLVAAVVAVPNASAQNSQRDDWRQGTELSAFAGAASTSSDTGAAAGAALAWELTPRFTIEGSGIWTDGPRGSTSFAAIAGSRVNLLPRRTVVPFLSGGIGVFRSSFGGDTSAMPDFYHRRMMRTAGSYRDREFTDLAFAIGGGVDVFLQRHLALRPDVRVLLITADSRLRPVALVGVHLAYHFESHNVTPTRRDGR